MTTGQADTVAMEAPPNKQLEIPLGMSSCYDAPRHSGYEGGGWFDIVVLKARKGKRRTVDGLRALVAPEGDHDVKFAPATYRRFAAPTS
jgi:hypothetical protein